MIAYFYDSSKQVGGVFNFDWCVSLRITMSFFFRFYVRNRLNKVL